MGPSLPLTVLLMLFCSPCHATLLAIVTHFTMMHNYWLYTVWRRTTGEHQKSCICHLIRIWFFRGKSPSSSGLSHSSVPTFLFFSGFRFFLTDKMHLKNVEIIFSLWQCTKLNLRPFDIYLFLIPSYSNFTGSAGVLSPPPPHGIGLNNVFF